MVCLARTRWCPTLTRVCPTLRRGVSSTDLDVAVGGGLVVNVVDAVHKLQEVVPRQPHRERAPVVQGFGKSIPPQNCQLVILISNSKP